VTMLVRWRSTMAGGYRLTDLGSPGHSNSDTLSSPWSVLCDGIRLIARFVKVHRWDFGLAVIGAALLQRRSWRPLESSGGAFRLGDQTKSV
jgi:hypothetical protein